ncbi:hypothetical protein P168DRAFT_325974 [Aspergillus campestris IBT 28561]|uniref:Rhodopsin domain-containing protein n=1 Tax=Aspergillus campestris (strain IBT 28561) TaxID=1392248 RepID=A0A2I1D6Y3_ASPC2|nr:uncharacterized protein P168DRAFT_325974 [Aspergillus campestris IBT 28561]PKY05635.1 hypothetical protein P168DRAFT_325974 [Aspergillus campestris IBT 28561]
MSTRTRPFQVLSDDNNGVLITIVSVSFLIATIIFVAAKFGSVIYFKQRRTAVNTPIWVAVILVIVEVIVVQKGVDHGVGRHGDTLSTEAIQTASKFIYASQLIQIVILSLSQVSTILLVWKLTPDHALRQACTVTAGLSVGWTVFAILGTAFQCQMPEPWSYSPDRCAGEGAIMYPIWAIHILTEFAIIAIPFFMMRNVQMVLAKRIKILCAFFARSLVVVLSVVRLCLLPTYLGSSDQTWDVVNPTILGQAMICTTVTIACLPTLYHILAGLNSGLMNTRLPDEVELRSPTKYISQSADSHSESRRGDRPEYFRGGDPAQYAAVRTNITTMGRRQSSDSGKGSTRQLTRVMKTVDITVEVEGGERH